MAITVGQPLSTPLQSDLGALEQLPWEVRSYLNRFIPTLDIKACMEVNHKFYDELQDEIFWKDRIRRDFHTKILRPEFKDFYINIFNQTKRFYSFLGLTSLLADRTKEKTYNCHGLHLTRNNRAYLQLINTLYKKTLPIPAIEIPDPSIRAKREADNLTTVTTTMLFLRVLAPHYYLYSMIYDCSCHDPKSLEYGMVLKLQRFMPNLTCCFTFSILYLRSEQASHYIRRTTKPDMEKKLSFLITALSQALGYTEKPSFFTRMPWNIDQLTIRDNIALNILPILDSSKLTEIFLLSLQNCDPYFANKIMKMESFDLISLMSSLPEKTPLINALISGIHFYSSKVPEPWKYEQEHFQPPLYNCSMKKHQIRFNQFIKLQLKIYIEAKKHKKPFRTLSPYLVLCLGMISGDKELIINVFIHWIDRLVMDVDFYKKLSTKDFFGSACLIASNLGYTDILDKLISLSTCREIQKHYSPNTKYSLENIVYVLSINQQCKQLENLLLGEGSLKIAQEGEFGLEYCFLYSANRGHTDVIDVLMKYMKKIDLSKDKIITLLEEALKTATQYSRIETIDALDKYLSQYTNEAKDIT